MNIIHSHVIKLVQKYEARNPFELAEALGILVIEEELGSINGYYNKTLRMKQIHINCNLPEHMKLFTCAHELGHALLHPNSNTPFLKSSTLFSVSRLEKEANRFAAELLIPDEVILENMHLTTEQLSRLLGYEQKFIELRFESYYEI